MADKKPRETQSVDQSVAPTSAPPQADAPWKRQALEYWAQGLAALDRIGQSVGDSVDGAVRYLTTGNDIMGPRARQNLAEADGSADKVRAAREEAAAAAAAEEAKRRLPNGMSGAPGPAITYAQFKADAKNQRNAKFLVEHGEAASMEAAFTVLWARHPINEKRP